MQRCAKTLIALALILAIVPLAGCTCKGMVRAEAVAPLIEDVAKRHDALVEADAGMTEAQKEVALRSTEILRRLMEEALAEEGDGD